LALKEASALLSAAVRGRTWMLRNSWLAESKTTLGRYLSQRQDRLTEAHRQLVWALLASAEFRFNY